MDKQQVVAALNRNLALEYSTAIQYLQHSFLVQGAERETFAPFFARQADESLGQVKKLGDKIAALGGVPTVEPARVQQATTLQEMLQQDLAKERDSVRAYTEAYALVGDDDVALRVFLEELIFADQGDVEELEKLLAQRAVAAAQPDSRRQRATGS